MNLVKVIVLQAYWYLCVVYGHQYPISIYLLAVVLNLANFFVCKINTKFAHYLFVSLCFIVYGLIQEYILVKTGLVSFGTDSAPLWINGLYVVFIGYYGDLFNYMTKFPKWALSLLGAIGGVLAYYGGSKLSPLTPTSDFYYVAIAIGWGIFFPLSFKLFYEGFMWNKLLDASIFFSFDQNGYHRHKKNFIENIKLSAGKKVLITGGTSGIGKATAESMAKAGLEVMITGRNISRGQKLADQYENFKFIQWDQLEWDKINSIVNSLPSLDYLVLNAGGMPDQFIPNSKGIESQFASQLFAHYYLLKELHEKNKLKPDAKVVWVTSGGMYLANLDLNTMTDDMNYDKVTVYAQVKRAQVTLLDYIAKEFSDYTITAMHPGWAKTPAVESAIPKFNNFMQGRLRTPLEACDTILWLCSTQRPIISGGLYFDRRQVKKHFFPFTKKSDAKLEELVNILKENRKLI